MIAQRVASRWLAARQRQRRQKGQSKIERRRRYRKTRSKAKKQSARYRKTHKSKTKRYQKRYRKNPKRFQRKRANILAFTDTPFFDLEHGMDGQVQQVDVDEELVQTTVNGESKQYGLWDFLDSTVFPSEDGEGDFFGQLDQEFEYDETDVDEDDYDADDDGIPDDIDDDFDLGPSGV